jgi:Holliday junction resolvasome RuvABC DNA-binding subunit
MDVDLERTAKILSRGLTALVSLRALFRSGVGIKKLLAEPKAEPKSGESKAKKEPAKAFKPTDEVKRTQLHGALLQMGYSRPNVDHAVKELSGKIDSDSLPDLVRAALGILNSK